MSFRFYSRSPDLQAAWQALFQNVNIVIMQDRKVCISVIFTIITALNTDKEII